MTDLPVLVGVGIGTPEQAVEVCEVADGVIVGSAIVRRMLEAGSTDAVGELVGEFRAALDLTAENRATIAVLGLRSPVCRLGVTPLSFTSRRRLTMNKTELVETIARRTELSKKDVDAVLTTFFDVVRAGRREGQGDPDDPGVDQDRADQRSARTGRNPQTGAEIKIPASKGVKITAGATLKAIAKGDKPAPK